MTSEEVIESNDWLIVEWEDFTRTIVHASEQVCDLKDQIVGSTVFIKRDGGSVRTSLVARSADRQELVRQINKGRGKPLDAPLSDGDYEDPSDFEPSATDWVPSDENASDSEAEVENKKRRIDLSKVSCKNRKTRSNVLTPSNKINTSARPRNTRKQTAPKQFISPPKEDQLCFVPLPKKQISPSAKRIHVLPNSTKPVPTNFTKQVNSTKQIAPYGKNNNQRKRTYPGTKKNTPKQNASEKEPEKNENKENNENTSEETPITNKTVLNKLNKVSNSQNVSTEPEAKNKNVLTENVNENSENVPKINNNSEEQLLKKYPGTMNVMMDVRMFLEFRQSIRKMHEIYDTALKVLPMIKRKKLRVKKFKKCFKPQKVETDKELKQKHDNVKLNDNTVNDTNATGAENLSDENVENEHLDDFDRSDDNILISNKFENINTSETPTEKSKNKDNKWVAIGSGKTLIAKDKFRKIKWNSYTVATRGLLLAAFPRRVLATHSMTGKKSPAFLNKPAKMCLDPKKVADIIIEVMDRFKIRENLIRSVITTKCADEAKMFKMRMQKKESSVKETTTKEVNPKNNPTLAA